MHLNFVMFYTVTMRFWPFGNRIHSVVKQQYSDRGQTGGKAKTWGFGVVATPPFLALRKHSFTPLLQTTFHSLTAPILLHPLTCYCKHQKRNGQWRVLFFFSIIELQDSSFSGNVMLQCSLNSPPPSSLFRSVPEGPWQRGGAEGLLLSRLFFTLCLHDFGVLWWPLPLSTPLYPLPPRPATPVAFLPCRQRRWLRPFQIVRPLAQQRLSVQQYPCGSSIKVLTTLGDRYCLFVH